VTSSRYTARSRECATASGVCQDVLTLQPTTLDALQKAANVVDACKRQRGNNGNALFQPTDQLAGIVTLMAKLMGNGGTQPPVDTATTTSTVTTAPANPATTATSATPPAGLPCNDDDRSVNINVVMPTGAERTNNTSFPAGRGR